MEMPIARLVREYIASHPSVKDCLKKDIVNYSSLARRIQEETGYKKYFNAFLVACARYAGESVKSHRALEDKVLETLKNGRIESRTKIAILVVKSYPEILKEILKMLVNELEHNVFVTFAQGTTGLTIFIDQDIASRIKEKYGPYVMDFKKNLLALIVKSGKEAQETVGYISFITGVLSENGINMIELIGSYTDLIILIDKKDFTKSIEVLDRYIE